MRTGNWGFAEPLLHTRCRKERRRTEGVGGAIFGSTEAPAVKKWHKFQTQTVKTSPRLKNGSINNMSNQFDYFFTTVLSVVK